MQRPRTPHSPPPHLLPLATQKALRRGGSWCLRGSLPGGCRGSWCLRGSRPWIGVCGDHCRVGAGARAWGAHAHWACSRTPRLHARLHV